MNQELISQVVQEVLTQLQQQGSVSTAGPGSSGNGASSPGSTSAFGIYEDMDQAVEAAHRAFQQLTQKGVTARKAAIQAIRKLAIDKADEWGRLEFEETRIGRLEAKIEKLRICGDLVPGVEFLERSVFSGDFGLTVIDFAPWGVIGAVTPSTHSVPTLTGNAINMIAAGNSVVFNTHPAACNCANVAIQEFNKAIFAETGISDLLCAVRKPTLESFDGMLKNEKVRLMCVTGGPALKEAAMKANKRAIVAGPGNPPVVVDETADLPLAARSIIQGAAYDNNLLCIGEKEVFVVEKVADQLLKELENAGAHRLDAAQVDALTQQIFTPKKSETGVATSDSAHEINRKMIGQNANVLAGLIGLNLPDSLPLIFGETREDHPFVQEEQMMPFLPIVRVPDVNAAIQAALRAEHGYKHTAVMHSRDIGNLTKFAQLSDTTLFIKNGPSMTGLGLGGEGFLSFSVATPTGEGVTTPMTFTRSRRCVMVENLNLY